MDHTAIYNSMVLSKHSIYIVPAILIGMIIIIATWYINKIVQKIMINIEANHKLDHTLVKACQNIVHIFIYAIGATLFLENFHIKMSSLLGTLGVLTIGVGFALQQALANMTSGMLLLFYKPFFIGDYIISEDPKFEGEVIDIDLRSTTLKYQGNIVLIPNHTMYSSIVTIKKQN